LVAMSADENELMLSAVLNAFVDALNILLKWVHDYTGNV
jgi:hypothetical protein